MAITASMVKELREMTGAGMMDCKKALTETNGDMDAAVEFLRKNGQAKAEKKAGRIAADILSVSARKIRFRLFRLSLHPHLEAVCPDCIPRHICQNPTPSSAPLAGAFLSGCPNNPLLHSGHTQSETPRLHFLFY